MKTAKKKMIQALNDLLLTFAFENGNLKIQILVQCQFYDLAVRCFCYFARSDRVNKQLTKNDELIFFPLDKHWKSLYSYGFRLISLIF